MPTYQYNITDTLNDKVEPAQLGVEITDAILPYFQGINVGSGLIDCEFSSALDSAQQTTLTGVINAHAGESLAPGCQLNPGDNGIVCVGDQSAGVDYSIRFNGENSQQNIQGLEDEDLIKIDTNLRIDNSTNSAFVYLLAANTALAGIEFGDTDDSDIGRIYYDHDVNDLVFVTNTSEAMRIDDSQNVGIGTAPDASARLKIDGDLYIVDNGNNATIVVGDDTGTNYGSIFWDSASDYLRLETDANGLKINDNNVQIGNVFPSNLFGVANGSTQQLVVTENETQIVGNLNHDGDNIGFFGTAPTTKPTVTGSRGDNAALASLLTALENLGLITDSST
jgi:hypothetical protein